MKVLIVDDERLARERLARLLIELDDAMEIMQADNGVAALKLVDEHMPTVLLLDIHMPIMGGLEVADHLTRLAAPPAVIFTTAHADYAVQAFDTNALDYLMKPIRKERLSQALKKTGTLHPSQINRFKRNADLEVGRSHLSTTVNGRLQIVSVEKIHYLKAEHKYVSAVWPAGELLIDDSLKSLEREFTGYFMRIHRNTLVALKYVQALDKDADGNAIIKLHTIETPLAVSRRHLGNVRKTLKVF